MFGISFKTAAGGFTQISRAEPTLRVIESGVLASGSKLAFARPAGALFVRAKNLGKKIYCNSTKTKIFCEDGGGGVAYVVVGNASDFAIPTGYGLAIRSSTGILSFSNKMQFPRVRYVGTVRYLENAPLTIPMKAPYPTSHYYIAIQSLGLDSFQIGRSFITYENIAFKVASNSLSVQLSSFQTQVSSGQFAGKSFKADIDNYIQILEV